MDQQEIISLLNQQGLFQADKAILKCPLYIEKKRYKEFWETVKQFEMKRIETCITMPFNKYTRYGYDKERYFNLMKPIFLQFCKDAIKVGVVKRQDIPDEIVKVLGNNNSKIVDTLIKDVIINSYNKPYLQFSVEVFNALIKLQSWNYKLIYESEIANKNYEKIDKLFRKLFDKYLEILQNERYKYETPKGYSEKYLFDFMNKMSLKNGFNLKRTIVDYIAGQTDKFFLNECRIHLGTEEIYNFYN